MKITWIKSHSKYGYFAGDSCDIDDKLADELIKSKHVKLFEAPKVKKVEIDLPADLPGRDALIANSVKTLADVKLITDFTALKGIGKATNTQILEYLKALSN